jgi:peptidoglycan hydrolase-like protein with peptidoglycan-binding domain
MTDNTSPTKKTARTKAAAPETNDENSVSVPSVSFTEFEAQQSSAVVGTGATDPVLLSAIKYKNIHQKKSLSVHHLQRRLNELGYHEAYADEDGYFGDLTEFSVSQFQKDNELDVTGRANAETLEKIFDGDNNVTLTID